MNTIVITGSTGAVAESEPPVEGDLDRFAREPAAHRRPEARDPCLVSDGRITRIDAIRNPDKLRRL